MSSTVTGVAVEPASEGSGLVVRWTMEGDGPVAVCAGRAPDAIDHRHPLAMVTDATEITLADLGPGRHYVSVAPAGGGSALIAADRRVVLEGALNFRDLGGYPTGEGRRTRWGRVFRSDALHLLTEADRSTLASLGLRTVYDLRRDIERSREPSLLAEEEGRRTVVLVIGGEASEQPEILDQIMSGDLLEADDDFVAGLYGGMLDTHAPDFGALLADLAESGALPALFHCTAGKDRTGVAAALLLSLLGVSEDVVLDDYELTTAYRSDHRIAELRPRLEAVGVDVEKVRPFLSARRPVLEATLARIHDDHGGVEGYLLGPGAMEAATLDELRRLLIDPVT